MKTRKMYGLLILLLAVSQPAVQAQEGSEPSEKETRMVLESTIEMSQKKLEENSDNAQEIGKVALGFVARLGGLDVTEETWPMVESFVEGLKESFSQASEGEVVSDSVSGAFDQLNDYLEQGRENFGSSSSGKEQESSDDDDDEEVEEKEAEDSAGFDLDPFVQGLEDVESPAEMKGFASSLMGSVPDGLDGDDKKTMVDFLENSLSSKLTEIGLDQDAYDSLEELYGKMGASWPGPESVNIVEEVEEFDLDEFISDGIETLSKITSPSQLKSVSISLSSELSLEDFDDSQKSTLGEFIDGNLSPKLVEIGVDRETFDSLQDFYGKVGIGWPGSAVKVLQSVESDDDEDEETEGVDEKINGIRERNPIPDSFSDEQIQFIEQLFNDVRETFQ